MVEKTGMIRKFPAACALLLSCAAPLKAEPPATHEPEEVAIALHPDLSRAGPVFEGWGTALAWFANVTGGWPKAEREKLADLFYSAEGLKWNIARYNIGGGNSQATEPYLRTGAAVPGFWTRPAGASGGDWWNPDDPRMWDWSADGNQRWWLDAIRERVREPIFEAFSNSPPWFMTISGRVSGAANGNDDNLRPGMEALFADYLARVTEELQKRHRIRFRTLSAFNEPNTDYWHAANTQEGSHWSPQRQAAMIDATYAALKRRGLDVAIAAPDETNSHIFLRDWAAFPAQTRARIGQLNVHSYDTIHQTAVRDIARTSGIRLWMSENDTPLAKEPEDFDAMPPALAFAEHVVMDLKRLEPSAWVFWQAVEKISARDGKPGTNWGLIKADLAASADQPHEIHVTRKYWAMAQFSRFIEPGFRLVPVDDFDSAAAVSPDGRRLVIVHVNGGLSPRRLVAPSGWHAAMIVTDKTRNATCAAGVTAPPQSIVTLVLARKKELLPCR